MRGEEGAAAHALAGKLLAPLASYVAPAVASEGAVA